MKIDPGDFTPHTETLVAVVLGAVLATLSGLLGTHFEARLRRAERQRDSALFMGEILLSLGVLIDETTERKKLGAPYGPITLRMLGAARRELDLYERRREQLYDVRDGALRGRIHGLMVRLTLPIDGILASTESLRMSPEQPDLAEVREGAFDYMVHLRSEIPAVVNDLSRLAGEPIAPYRDIGIRPG